MAIFNSYVSLPEGMFKIVQGFVSICVDICVDGNAILTADFEQDSCAVAECGPQCWYPRDSLNAEAAESYNIIPWAFGGESKPIRTIFGE